MFDVTRRFHLALSDLGRRSGLIAGAAVLLLTATGFLLAALWTVLAHKLHWGPALASLVLGLVCVVVGGGLLLAARQARHTMPTAGDAQAEMEARARLVAEAAIHAAKARASQATASVGQRLQGLWDRGRYQADRAADDLDSATARMAQAFGGEDHASTERRGPAAAPVVALAGAFVIGAALAHAFRRDRDDEDAA